MLDLNLDFALALPNRLGCPLRLQRLYTLDFFLLLFIKQNDSK